MIRFVMGTAMFLVLAVPAAPAGIKPSHGEPLRASARVEAPDAVAMALVAAARKQTWVPVIYSPSYAKIGYPMGDVPWYLGVCTDVVVRAYRALGLDLQELVHKAGVGSGDTNIDHRRVEVLRKFFARAGESLAVSRDLSSYKAGDLVTFHLPNGTFSKTHIAIVSDRKSAKGTPLIIHNRGFGVQEEDWLSAEKITGHYRFFPSAARSAAG